MQWNEITPYKQPAGQAALVNHVLHESCSAGGTHIHYIVDHDGLPYTELHLDAVPMLSLPLACARGCVANIIDLYLGEER